jgi:hypothetical protein
VGKTDRLGHVSTKAAAAARVKTTPPSRPIASEIRACLIVRGATTPIGMI